MSRAGRACEVVICRLGVILIEFDVHRILMKEQIDDALGLLQDGWRSVSMYWCEDCRERPYENSAPAKSLVSIDRVASQEP